MRCEDVRPMLPELAERGLRPVGPVEVHLSRCADCSEELRRYRSVIMGLAELRDGLEEAPAALRSVMRAIRTPSSEYFSL